MRLLFLAATLSLAMTAAASASDPPNARETYVERRGLIEIDTRCRLLRADLRAALNVSMAQSRGALLREGWTNAQVRSLDQTVASAARNRACNDARTVQAAADAQRAFMRWINAGSMEFPGWERTWLARRGSADGWRLSQAIEAPVASVFGVRDREGSQRLALIVQVARGGAAPASAQLVMRNPRNAMREVPLTQRVAYGLQAGAPAPGQSASVPSTRSMERLGGGRSQIVFTFPDTAFRDLLALDPRETVEIRVNDGRRTQSLYVEVGDIAAARAFLTLR
jgi:hypothetical protein